MILSKAHLFSLLLFACSTQNAVSFAPLQSTQQQAHSLPVLLAKKKKTSKTRGKGFGTAPTPAPPVVEEKANTPPPPEPTTDASFLQSIEKGGSGSIPTVDESIPAEERAQKLLREQYGLRTLEEQRMQDSIQSQRQKLDKLKAAADKEDDIDIMAVLPAPLLKGIDTFLKAGVAVCTVLFVAAGFAIALEAWTKTTGNELPAGLDNFIVNTVEPNFTPGLLVLLAFSVSLGGFAALQLSSASSTYREE